MKCAYVPIMKMSILFFSGKTRKCCWNVEKRGALGETILHICFLNDTKIHSQLAKELISVFPNLCKSYSTVKQFSSNDFAYAGSVWVFFEK